MFIQNLSLRILIRTLIADFDTSVIIPNILMDLIILCLPTFEVSQLVSKSPTIIPAC